MNKFEQYLVDHDVETLGLKPIDLRKEFPEGSMLFNVSYRKHPEEFEVVYLDPISHRLEVMPFMDVPIFVILLFLQKSRLSIPTHFVGVQV